MKNKRKRSKEGETPNTVDSSQLLDKVLEIFKELFRGIFYLHNKNKKSTTPAVVLATSEFDPASIEILTDMGFSSIQARQALSLFSSVDEAADHLLMSGAMPTHSFALNVEEQPEVCFEIDFELKIKREKSNP